MRLCAQVPRQPPESPTHTVETHEQERVLRMCPWVNAGQPACTYLLACVTKFVRTVTRDKRSVPVGPLKGQPSSLRGTFLSIISLSCARICEHVCGMCLDALPEFAFRFYQRQVCADFTTEQVGRLRSITQTVCRSGCVLTPCVTLGTSFPLFGSQFAHR